MTQKAIRFIAQMYDVNSGNVMEESILQEEVLSKAETLKELGYLHIQQNDILLAASCEVSKEFQLT